MNIENKHSGETYNGIEGVTTEASRMITLKSFLLPITYVSDNFFLTKDGYRFNQTKVVASSHHVCTYLFITHSLLDVDGSL